MSGTRTGFKIIPQIFNSIPIHQHELDLQTFKASIIQHYDTWVNNLVLESKKKNPLSPMPEVYLCYHISHNDKVYA